MDLHDLNWLIARPGQPASHLNGHHFNGDHLNGYHLIGWLAGWLAPPASQPIKTIKIHLNPFINLNWLPFN